MRRLLSILLLLVLGLGPTTAAIPANAFAGGMMAGLRAGLSGQPDDSQLPACCRRNGKHHCALSNRASSSLGAPRETTISANDCCPCAPQPLDSTAPSISAILAEAGTSAAVPSEFRILQTISSQARLTAQHTQPQRGPPTMKIL
jgi:hypothetical protein